MGLKIDREQFEEADYSRFSRRLGSCLEALAQLLEDDRFGAGETSIGAELELSLVDDQARPQPLNLRVLGETLDPRMTVELDRFNLECNLRHCNLAGSSLAKLEQEMIGALAEVRRAAATHDSRVAMIGILPTLEERDLQSGAMTDTPRFRALSAGLKRLRRKPFRLRIYGDEPLSVLCDDVTFEGAATSLQVHLRVAPAQFASLFNAIQIATAPVLAIAGNSPTFLGKRLWEETRIALFKQAVDHRDERERRQGEEPRVSFGSRWVEKSAIELFREAVMLHEPLLPLLSDQDPLKEIAAGKVPRLEEMRLHQGTVWSWNRPVFDPDDGGHLRIEIRALPAGPSIIDMLANTAFLIGLARGLTSELGDRLTDWPFSKAHGNFYRAAQSGLEAQLHWPDAKTGVTRAVKARELIPTLLPIARSGLDGAGVDAADSDRLLDVIAKRCESGQTGARWQLAMLTKLEERHGRQRALAEMLERYMEASAVDLPVHVWPVES